MPNRIIKESACTSETLAEISADAERLFWRIVVQADDYGCFDGRPQTVLGKCLTAFIGRVSLNEIGAWLDELEQAGLIRRYTVDDRPYIHISNWAKHQRPPRAAKPKWPLPPVDQEDASADTRCQLTADDDNGGQVAANAPVSGIGIGIGNVSENVSENENEIDDDDDADTRARAREAAPAPESAARAAVIDAYYRNIEKTLTPRGDMRPMIVEELHQLIDDLDDEQHGPELVIEAIRETARAGAKSIKYLSAVVQTWKEAGIRDPTGLAAYREQQEARRQAAATKPRGGDRRATDRRRDRQPEPDPELAHYDAVLEHAGDQRGP